jgi:hypothetical protein
LYRFSVIAFREWWEPVGGNARPAPSPERESTGIGARRS